MAKKVALGGGAFIRREGKKKTTSSGRPSPKTKTSSMNKHRKRSFKVYRGQGRA